MMQQVSSVIASSKDIPAAYAAASATVIVPAYFAVSIAASIEAYTTSQFLK